MSTPPKATILIVDDNPRNVMTLRELLSTDYKCIVATNGQQALERMKQRPDLILLDVGMPDMNGFEVCRRLKKNPDTRDTSVIFVTAFGESENEVEGLEAGGVDYIVKPVNAAITKARVATHLGKAQAEKALRDLNATLEEKVAEQTKTLEAQKKELEHLLILRQRHETEKREFASTDTATGLCNRAEIMVRLERSVNESRRQKGFEKAVIFLQLERWEEVATNLGSEALDGFLAAFAKKLEGAFRKTDHLSRLDGGAYVVLFSNLPKGEDAENQAARLMERFFIKLEQQLFEYGEHKIPFSVKVGISPFSEGNKEALQILQEAKAAIPKTPTLGNEFGCTTPALTQKAIDRLQLEYALRRALRDDELMVYYQPKVEIRTGRITSMEALVRWKHPKQGMIFPDIFIPLAEETGLIVPVGEWVLKTSCVQTSQWQKIVSGLKVAVNLSGVQFQKKNLIEKVRGILDETGFSPELLELEITESMVMGNVEEAIAKMQQLRDLGISLAMDDFGTGYSSLVYLKDFPIQTLKIDKAFIQGIRPDLSNSQIANAIIGLSKSLNLHIVAEGVETEAHIEFLIGRGCDTGQGYRYSKPVPADAFEALLKKGKLP